MKKLSLLLVVALLVATMGTTTAQDEEITLVVWDNFTREAEQEMIEELNAMFEEMNPNVTIQREAYDTSDLTQLAPRALSEDNGPDVIMVNQGFSGMGALVEAGLLLPLNDYADQYGWWDRYAEGLHARNSFSEDGTEFGTGNLYSVSNTAEVVGIYYHKSIFEELGLEVPTTWDEFVSALTTIQEGGYTPIVFGSLDGWPAIHTWGAIQHAYSDLATIDNFMYRAADGTFETEANVQAAETMLGWIENGYFSPGFEGMDYDNATYGAFIGFEGAMWLTGSWMTGSIVEDVEDAEATVGFFLLPSAAGEEVPLTIGGVGLGYGIRAGTEHADIAAAYIDLITGPEAANLLFAQGYLPAITPEEYESGTLTGDVIEAWELISSSNKVGHYLDWTAPDIAADIQEMMAGEVSPDEFTANVQEDYESGE
ncbi:MAG: extracellular solute-binding protein [Chloroflexi bacterium]|nr:extracellular solute-binding protein [Chloroflexota bacterium]